MQVKVIFIDSFLALKPLRPWGKHRNTAHLSDLERMDSGRWLDSYRYLTKERGSISPYDVSLIILWLDTIYILYRCFYMISRRNKK